MLSKWRVFEVQLGSDRKNRKVANFSTEAEARQWMEENKLASDYMYMWRAPETIRSIYGMARTRVYKMRSILIRKLTH